MAKKKSGLRIFFIILIILVVIVGAALIYLKSLGPNAIKVVSSKVEKRTITQTVSAIGKIEPETEVKISSETSGEIIFLGPQEGDSVKANELLIRIKPDIIETQLEQYKAASEASRMDVDVRKAEKERAAAELKRMTSLYEKEFISKQEFDRVKTVYDQAVSTYGASLKRYEQALAGLKQIQRNALRTTITSPIPGVVTKLSVEKGEKVVGTEMMQGTEIMRISDLSVMNAVVDVDENDIVLVDIGDTVDIEIDAFPDRMFIGMVVEIGHSAKVNALGTQDQVTNFEVKIRLLDEEPKLRPGMSCNVEIKTETHYDVLSVPLQAVTVREDKKKEEDDEGGGMGIRKKEDDSDKAKDRPPSVVFLKKSNKAKKVEVETGISDKGFIEVTKGLKLGQEVISGSFKAVSKDLYDGAVIQIDSTYHKKFKKSN